MDDFDPTAFENELEASPGEEEEQIEKSEYKQLPHRQAQLVVIDCHSVRLLFNNSSITWKSLLTTLTDYAKGRIISHDNDKWGLLLYGTGKSNNQFSMPHLTEILPIDHLTVHSIRSLMDLSDLTFDKFLEEYGSLSDVRPASQRQTSSAACPISGVFRYALRSMRTNAPVFKFNRKILLFTHRPDPCANLPQDRSVATQLGLDLINNNVTIDLFPISVSESRSFDLALFYQDIVDASVKRGLANTFEANTDQFVDQKVSEKMSLTLLSTLKVELKRKSTQQRVLQKTELKVAPGLNISTALFLVIGEAKKPLPVLLRASDHRPLYSETVYIDSGTGNLLAKDERRRFYDFEGLRATFSEEEMNFIKAIQTRPKYERFPEDKEETHRMTILGFKPIAALDRHRFSIKLQVYFLFPSENEIKGSSKVFHALIRAMWSLQRYAVITFQYRANSAPRMFAGVPQIGEDADGRPLIGMFLIALPFADEIRDVSVDRQVSEATVEAAYDTMKNDLIAMLEKLDLTDRRQVEEIGNPALAKHFGGLEALALGSETAPEVDDLTKPDQQVFDNIQDDLLKLQQQFGLVRGVKRAAPSSRGETTASQIDPDHIRGLAETGRLSTLTVPQLKSALTTFGLLVSGRKQELVERLSAHCKSKGK